MILYARRLPVVRKRMVIVMRYIIILYRARSIVVNTLCLVVYPTLEYKFSRTIEFWETSDVGRITIQRALY